MNNAKLIRVARQRAEDNGGAVHVRPEPGRPTLHL